MWDDGVGALGRVLADDLVTHDVATVTHADLAWLGLPHVAVRKDLSVQGTAAASGEGAWDEWGTERYGAL